MRIIGRQSSHPGRYFRDPPETEREFIRRGYYAEVQPAEPDPGFKLDHELKESTKIDLAQ